MSSFNWYPRYTRKALDGMRALTLEQRGAYSTLLDLIYDRGGAIPDDDRWLAGNMNVSVRRWKAIRSELIGLGRIVARQDAKGSWLADELADIEIAKQASRRKLNVENGAKGGDKSALTRAKVNKDNAVAEATAQPIDKDIDKEPPVPPKGGDRDEVRIAFDEWNELAERLGLPKAKTLDAGRRKAIKARLGFEGMGGWLDALAAVERSRHCRGENDRGWKADLDFVCQAKSFRRLVEGSYGADAVRPVDQPPPQRPVIWNGPDEVRALVLHGLAGGGKPPSLLDTRCTWRDLPTRAIITDNPFTAADLRFNCQIDLHRAGIEIVCAESQAA